MHATPLTSFASMMNCIGLIYVYVTNLICRDTTGIDTEEFNLILADPPPTPKQKKIPLNEINFILLTSHEYTYLPCS